MSSGKIKPSPHVLAFDDTTEKYFMVFIPNICKVWYETLVLKWLKYFLEMQKIFPIPGLILKQ